MKKKEKKERVVGNNPLKKDLETRECWISNYYCCFSSWDCNCWSSGGGGNVVLQRMIT